MRRSWGLVATVVIGGVGGLPAAKGQDASAPGRVILALFVAGDSGGPTSREFFWANAPDDVRALAVGQAVSLGANPLTAGWVQLTVNGQPTAMPSPADPPLPVSLTGGPVVFSGGAVRPPAGLPQLPAAAGGGSGGGAVGGGAAAKPVPSGSSGLPMLGLGVRIPDGDTPGEAAFTLRNPDGSLIGGASVPVPAGGWWSLAVGSQDSLPTGGASGVTAEPLPATDPLAGVTPPPPPLTPPPPPPTDGNGGGGGGDTGGGMPTTPEPGTVLLAGIGAVAVLGWRRLRRA